MILHFDINLVQIVFSTFFSEHIEMAKKAFEDQKSKVFAIEKEQEDLKSLIYVKRNELKNLDSKVSGLTCIYNFMFDDNGKNYNLAMKILKKDNGVINYHEWEHLYHVGKICNRKFLKNNRIFFSFKDDILAFILQKYEIILKELNSYSGEQQNLFDKNIITTDESLFSEIYLKHLDELRKQYDVLKTNIAVLYQKERDLKEEHYNADVERINLQLKINALKYLHYLLITDDEECQAFAMKIVRVTNDQFDIYEWRNLREIRLCNLEKTRYSWRDGFQEYLIEQYEEIFNKTKAFFN